MTAPTPSPNELVADLLAAVTAERDKARRERDRARQRIARHLLECESTDVFARRAKSGSFQQNT